MEREGEREKREPGKKKKLEIMWIEILTERMEWKQEHAEGRDGERHFFESSEHVIINPETCEMLTAGLKTISTILEGHTRHNSLEV